MLENKKIGIIIQARMGSTRLPSKIMMPINNRPVFEYQLDRLRDINYPIYIATTTKLHDDVIERFAIAHKLQCFRGDEDNVLKRYYDCAVHFNLDIIIRITSDCPLIDATVINDGINKYLLSANDAAYLSNTIQRTYPRGFDFEIFSFALLEDAYNNAVDKSDTEHVTPYIWKNKSGNVTITQLKQKINYSSFRLTLDTQEDLKLISLLIRNYDAHTLSGIDICKVMANNPQLHEINSHIDQKKV